MLLAAGKGERMLPLTESTPKPLLNIGQHSLIEHHILRLAKLGFEDIVINIAYLSEQIKHTLKDGSKYGVKITYSDESKTGALETAGGIKKAQSLIKSDPFIVINSDIYTDFPFDKLAVNFNKQAKLILVTNPEHNPNGDFAVSKKNLVTQKTNSLDPSFTFSGIAIYQKSVFEDIKNEKQALLPVFNSLIEKQQMQGEIYTGGWTDVGTPERLKKLDNALQNKTYD